MLGFDVEIGIRYVAFFGLSYFALHWARGESKVLMTIALITFFAAYFIRGALVASHYEYFNQISIYPVDRSIILTSFDSALIGIGAFLLGLILFCVKPLRAAKRIASKPKYPFLIKYVKIIITLLLGLAILMIVLRLYGNVGRKGVENTGSLGFLLQLAPIDIPFLLIGIYLFKYVRRLSTLTRFTLVVLMLLFSYSILMSGGKAFLIIAVMIYAVYALHRRKHVPILRMAIFSTVMIILMGFSFVVANVMKVSFILPHLSSGELIELAMKNASKGRFGLIVDDITSRFNGFDGQLKYYGMKRHDPSSLSAIQKSTHIKPTVLNIFEGLIPKVDLTDQIPWGVAVGIYAERVDPRLYYGGALGLVGMAQVIGGKYYPLFMILVGCFIGVLFRLRYFIHESDLRFIFLYLCCYLCMIMVMGGNLDTALIDFITKIGVLTGYIFIVLGVGKMLTTSKSIARTKRLSRIAG